MTQINAEVARTLAEKFAEADPRTIYDVALNGLFGDRIAVVSSFGTEAAVSLSLMAEIRPQTPVIFVDTGMHFPQTTQYVEELSQHLGLTNLVRVTPSEAQRQKTDPLNNLWKRDTDRCCALRKVAPLDDALIPYSAWVTGRKRFHGGERADLPAFEFVGGKFKVNPLVNLSHAAIQEMFEARGLPRHPMETMGYASIGCWPCTEPSDGEDVRAGRWKGQDKTECGIHRTALINTI